MDNMDLIIKALGLGVTATAAVVAAGTFVRNEKWKRAEFLAREMKEFLSSDHVMNTFTMIDWAARTIKLLPTDAPNSGLVHVTQKMSSRALYPHALDGEAAEGEASPTDGGALRLYTVEETAIRDCFDAFLDGLERLNDYRKARLITLEQLRPYLDYWIKDIAARANSKMEAEFSAALVTYIHFYGYVGVTELFAAWGYRIDPESDIYAGFLDAMDNNDLKERLKALAVDKYSRSQSHAS